MLYIGPALELSFKHNQIDYMMLNPVIKIMR